MRPINPLTAKGSKSRPCSASYRRRNARRLRFEVIRRYGLWLYSIKLGRVHRRVTVGGVYYEKQRVWRTAPLIMLANPLLKATGSLILGLPQREWLWWELQLAPLTMGHKAKVYRRTLRLPEIAGVRLADYLSASSSLHAKCTAITAAASELYRLHHLQVRFPGGGVRPFSHADAHVKNVIYDGTTDSAVWFDFEAMHVSSLAASHRQADDWRAFSYSAAAYFSLKELPPLANIIAQSCQETAVRHALAATAYRLQYRPTAFHLAQAHLDFRKHQAFSAALIKALKMS